MAIQLLEEIDGGRIGFGTGPQGVIPGRPTLVLLHGAGGSRESWKNQMAALDESMNVVALEQPGHGLTPGPLVDSVPGLADWVERVIRAWGLPDKPILAGHSLGGAIALEVGLTRPDLVRGLVLLSTGARLEVNAMIFDLLRDDFEGMMGMMGKIVYAKTTDPEIIREGIGLMAQASPEALTNDFRACDRFDRREDVKGMNVPALVVCGRQDKMTGPALSEFLAENTPRARLVLIDGAGHVPMDEQPDQLNRIITEFVTGLD